MVMSDDFIRPFNDVNGHQQQCRWQRSRALCWSSILFTVLVINVFKNPQFWFFRSERFCKTQSWLTNKFYWTFTNYASSLKWPCSSRKNATQQEMWEGERKQTTLRVHTHISLSTGAVIGAIGLNSSHLSFLYSAGSINRCRDVLSKTGLASPRNETIFTSPTGFTGTEIIHTGTFVPGRTGERKKTFFVCGNWFQISDFRVYELFIY